MPEPESSRVPREVEQSSSPLLVDIVRHTKSPYNNYVHLDRSGADPNKYVNYESQLADITEMGRDMAAKAAEEYAATIDPEKEMIVVISSREMRAYQTAVAYARHLEGHHIEIFGGVPGQQENYPVGVDTQENPLVEEDHNRVVIDPRIVVDKRHSTPRYRAMWEQDLFNPGDADIPVENQDALSAENRARYEQGREMVHADDQGSWGKNYAKYSTGEHPFDTIPTPEQRRQTMIRGLSLLRRLHNSPETRQLEQETGKRLRYLVVTHEENLLGMLQEFDGRPQIGNCERLSLVVPEGQNPPIQATFGDKQATLTDLRVA